MQRGCHLALATVTLRDTRNRFALRCFYLMEVYHPAWIRKNIINRKSKVISPIVDKSTSPLSRVINPANRVNLETRNKKDRTIQRKNASPSPAANIRQGRAEEIVSRPA